ncbi:MAG: DUF429 domain-containing protein [Acidobacteria bacterium]|nr:DUF429 domain-containing protein [Acidobacteriota bacterium]
MQIVGVDGCPAGWIAVVENLETRRIESAIFPKFAELAELDAKIIAIDIPIGLPERGPRDCDLLARKRLGPKRGSSVFPAPVRACLGATSHPEASDLSHRAHGKRLSIQAWNIVKKIAEVDLALRASPALQERVFEVHPEVTFAFWNGAPILAKKKRSDGKAIRRQLVEAHFGANAFVDVRKQSTRDEAEEDDILDAFAALFTAERIEAKIATTLPDPPPRDALRLPMRIVF